MTEYTMIIEKDIDGYFISEILELPGCHTQAKTMDKLLERTKEAIELYLEVEGENSQGISSGFIGVQKIAIE